jgi:hypothetical protein
MKIFIEDTRQVFGLAAGFIAALLIICFTVGSCIDRCSKNEARANVKPIVQEIPFK